VLLVTHDREAALRGNRILYLEDGMVTGELQLTPYRGRDEVRENQLTHWLEGFRW
ncbi:MAG: ABC transporter ATP-binding protein, partial [Lachnospiraceae bacterium]|nr:ABC transporter ATP-binding protein [Lachnospiraceae bacterium]